MKIFQEKFEDTDAKVHNGFYEQFVALRPAVEAFISKSVAETSVEDILITGHSLGGAVASLLAASLAPNFENHAIRVVTFGSPKPGNLRFQKLFQYRLGINPPI